MSSLRTKKEKERLLNRVEETIELLKLNIRYKEYSIEVDYLGCFMDIKESLQKDDVDWGYIDKKLSNYFNKEVFLPIKNTSSENQDLNIMYVKLYLDISMGCIQKRYQKESKMA